MNFKKITWICFVLLVVLQLWAPASMIYNREDVLKNGKAFKFRTAPVDPSDPFRGKYIVLSFDENSFENKEKIDWAGNEDIYVQLITDKAGYAKINAVNKKNMVKGIDYVKAKVNYLSYDSLKTIYIEWPFERFYMEESKALAAEQAYIKASADTSKVTYALIKVKNGDAVIENVFINNKPIVTLIQK